MPTNTPNSAIVRSGKLPLINKWLCYQQLNIVSKREAIIRLLLSMPPELRHVLAAKLGYGFKVGADRA